MNNVRYAIDMQKLMKWVTTSPSHEKNINTTITQVYGTAIDPEDDGDIVIGDEMVRKEITENKSTINENFANVRYDITRLMINTLFSEDMQRPVFGLEELTFTQRIAFETLLQEGFIFEITE